MNDDNPDKNGELPREMLRMALDCLATAFRAGQYASADAFFDDLLFLALLKNPPENGRATAFGKVMNELQTRIRFHSRERVAS
jgi:hypothetical protein